MPDLFDIDGLFKLPESEHAIRPLYIPPERCNTAEVADSANLGQRMTHTQHHMLFYRSPGPCHMSVIKDAEPDGTIYIPIHMPERRGAVDGSLVVFVYGKPDGEAELAWGEGLGSGTPTSFWTGWGNGTEYQTVVAVLDYSPPSGTGADSFTVIEIAHTNFAPVTVCAYHCGQRTIEPDQYYDSPGACAPGRVIDTSTASYGGLIQAVGYGDDSVESLERATRKVILCGTHPDGITKTGGAAWTNLFGAGKFAARCRDLIGSGADRYVYPVFVAKRTPGATGNTIIKVESQSGGEWMYTWQAGDGTDPILIHPWRTGANPADEGLTVASDGDDLITIKIYCDADHVAYVYAWALFEGSNY
jgi:hypothetical protein